MILLFSVRITHDRPASGNRYNRLDIFKYTLTTYKKLKFEKAYFFVELDAEFQHRKEELTNHIDECFPGIPIEIEFKRYTQQHEWLPFMTKLHAENGDDALVWFLQNDDHPFLDFDDTLFEEGLAHMRADPAPFKSMYVSHWPEILRLSGKLGNQERVGNFVKFKGTLLDTFQVHNMAYMKHLFIDLSWQGKSFTRIDGLVIMPSLTCTQWFWGVYRPTECWQSIYVPLREFCRKFNGYGKENFDMKVWPGLELPPNELKTDYSPEALVARMTAEHNTPWVWENKFRIPNEWVKDMLQIYKKGLETRDQTSV